MVGAGRWAVKHHVPAIVAHPGAELVGFLEPDAVRAAAFAAAFPGAVPFATVDELLGAGLDGLVVASPPGAHFESAAPALAEGVATLVEKPFTTDPAQAWDLVALAGEVPLVVGLTHQFTEAAAAVEHWLNEGAIGDIGTVSGIYHAPRAHLYELHDPGGENRLEDPSRLDQPLRATFSDPERAGGGQLINQVTHILGAVVAATSNPISRVAGAATRVPAGAPPGDRHTPGARVEVTASCLFEAADGALVAVSSHGASAQDCQRLVFDGTRGRIEWNLAAGSAELSAGGSVRRRVTSRPAYPAAAPFEGLMDLISDPMSSNRAPGRLGAHLVDVIAASYRAVSLGRSVAVARPTVWP